MEALKVIEQLLEEKKQLEKRQKEIDECIRKSHELIQQFFPQSSSSSSSAGLDRALSSAKSTKSRSRRASSDSSSSSADSFEAESKKQSRKKGKASSFAKALGKKPRGRKSAAAGRSSSSSENLSSTKDRERHLLEIEEEKDKRVKVEQKNARLQRAIRRLPSTGEVKEIDDGRTGKKRSWSLQSGLWQKTMVPFRHYSDDELAKQPHLGFVNRLITSTLDSNGSTYRPPCLRMRFSHLSDEDWDQLRPVIIEGLAKLTIHLAYTNKGVIVLTKIIHHPPASDSTGTCWCRGKWCPGAKLEIDRLEDFVDMLVFIYGHVYESDTTTE